MSRPRGARKALLAQMSSPLRQYLATESGSASILLVAAAAAVIWANSPWSAAYEDLWATEAAVQFGGAILALDLGHWVNDGLMALFFFVIGLEVRREFSVGELTDRRRAALPIAAGVAGMVVPAALYLSLNSSGPAVHGWGIVIGTDTAFMLGALAVVGPRFATQLRIFLLTLTVIDDIVAVTVIAVVYSDGVRIGWVLVGLACAAALVVLDKLAVWRTGPYLLFVVLLWLATLQAGIHGSIGGMVGGLLIRARPVSRETVESAIRRFRAFRQSPMADLGRSAQRSLERAISVNERLQVALHPWSSYLVVPLFALANAGVDLRGGVLSDALRSPVTWGVVIGLVVGKLVGISVTALAGTRLGLGRLPQGVRPSHVLGGAALSGIGFTVSLLITSLAFDDPVIQDEARVGVLLAALLAVLTGSVVFRVGRRLLGDVDADLPRTLDRPVDAAVDHIRGPVDAPLTLVEYGDFECPFCAKSTGVARELRQRFGDELRYVFRHLPLPDVHPHAELAARAAEAASAQGNFWAMHDLLFAHQDQLQLEDLVGYAADIGLDVEQFLRDIDDEEVYARVRADVASAEASGARGTPTFFVGDRRHIGPYDAETLAAALEASRVRQAEGLSPPSGSASP